MKPQTPDASQYQIPPQEEVDVEFANIVDLYNVQTEQDELDIQFASITQMYDRQSRQEREPFVDPVLRLLSASQFVHESRERAIAQEFSSMNTVTYLAKRAMTKGDLVELRRNELLQQEGALGAILWQPHPEILLDFHHETSENKHEWILARWLRTHREQPISFLRYVIETTDQHQPIIRRVMLVKTADGDRSESRLLRNDNASDANELTMLADAAQQYAALVQGQLHQSR